MPCRRVSWRVLDPDMNPMIGSGDVKLDVNLAVILVCPVAIPILEYIGCCISLGSPSVAYQSKENHRRSI